MKNKFNRTRKFFSSFSWSDSTDLQYPVFLNSEIENQPLKWLKYALLSKVGLTSINYLDETIFRFNPQSDMDILDRCRKLLVNDDNHVMVIIKIVYKDQAGQLPNFRVYGLDDLRLAHNFILENKSKAHEIWLCSSSVSQTGRNFGGRISDHLGISFGTSILEMVWFTSPRKIEEYRKGGFDYPYLRATKFKNIKTYDIEEISYPEKFNDQSDFENRLMTDLQWVLKSLNLFKENINVLSDILTRAGAKELSLEFKSSDGQFSIIDWDTELESIL